MSSVLVLYYLNLRPGFGNASTVGEHVEAFARYSRFDVHVHNTEIGMLPALGKLGFDAVVLHYSVFNAQVDGYFLDQGLRDFLAHSKAYKIAFFQDEHHFCQQRFAFLDKFAIDCVFTCLEESEFDKVYRRYTRVPTLVSNVPGYVSEQLVEASDRLRRSQADRVMDVGYRGRPLPPYMGRGALEKSAIGEEFLRRAGSTDLRLDIDITEKGRLYGEDWTRFVAGCWAMLGVESGVTVFDLEDEVREVYDTLIASGQPSDYEALQAEGTIRRWEDRVYYRTISPRHFEAAALGVCQVLFEGRYSGGMKPMVHYIPLRKDFSNFEEVVAWVRDPELRRELAANARRDLIDSGTWSYARLIERFDGVLEDAGLERHGSAADHRQVAATLRRGTRRLLLRRRARAVARQFRYRVALAIWPVTGRIRKLLGIAPPPDIDYPG